MHVISGDEKVVRNMQTIIFLRTWEYIEMGMV